MAIKLLDDGVAKPVVTVETDAAGRRMVSQQASTQGTTQKAGSGQGPGLVAPAPGVIAN